MKISLGRRHALMVGDGAFSHKRDYVTISKSRRAPKSQYWFNRYGNFAEWVNFACWWRCIGKGLRLQPAQQACFKDVWIWWILSLFWSLFNEMIFVLFLVLCVSGSMCVSPPHPEEAWTNPKFTNNLYSPKFHIYHKYIFNHNSYLRIIHIHPLLLFTHNSYSPIIYIHS